MPINTDNSMSSGDMSDPVEQVQSAVAQAQHQHVSLDPLPLDTLPSVVGNCVEMANEVTSSSTKPTATVQT